MVPAIVMAAALLGSCGSEPGDGGAKSVMAQEDKRPRYVKVKTAGYTIEVPEGWKVGEETPFGQRTMLPPSADEKGSGQELSSMTGPGLGKRSWQDLYETSLYFITRYRPEGKKMEATPYVVGKSGQGFETCSWSMRDGSGRTLQRHVILKQPDGNILALSVKLPPGTAKQDVAQLETHFKHMVETASLH